MPEILKPIKIEEKQSLVSFETVESMYVFASDHARTARKEELERCWGSIESASKKDVDQHWFLREFLWCVYVSGFSAQTISKKYDALLQVHCIEGPNGRFVPIEKGEPRRVSKIFKSWETGDALEPILKVFNNRNKASYVQQVRRDIYYTGWDEFAKKYVNDRDPKKLEELKGIGPALSCHLARNLGNVNVCKPDVHLKRVALRFGYDSVAALCGALADDATPVGKVDLILWLASVDHGTT